MVYHPRVDWWEGEVASSMIFGIHSPIPVSLNDPQQFQSYLRLYMHLPLACRIRVPEPRRACLLIPLFGSPPLRRAGIRRDRLCSAYPLFFPCSLVFEPRATALIYLFIL